MSLYELDADYINASIDIDDPAFATQKTLVTEKFNATLTKGDTVLEMLIGTDGTGGLIGEMTSALASAPSIAITADEVDTSMLIESSGLDVPIFDKTGWATIPTMDVNFGSAPNFPDDISVAISWVEATLPSEIYNAVKTQILADLVDGSTGITEEVETAIYTRARTRQEAANLTEYNRINGIISNLQHDLPSGTSVSLLADFGIAQARQEADLEYGIVEQQAKLAQDNRKAAIQGAINLDQLLRQTRDGESNRAYQSAKDLLGYTIQDYSERMRAVQIYWEGKRTEVSAKAEEIQAAIATNKGLVDIFVAETQGFAAAENAVGVRNESAVKLIQAKVNAAELSLRAQIAEAEELIKAYTAEMSINERISADRVNAASQVAASLLSAVHAGATISYSGSESASKSYGVSASISETHSAEHDPDA